MSFLKRSKSVFYLAIAVGLVAQLFISWWLIFHDDVLMADWPLALLVVQLLLSGTANLILALVFVMLARHADQEKVKPNVTDFTNYQPYKKSQKFPPGEE